GHHAAGSNRTLCGVTSFVEPVCYEQRQGQIEVRGGDSPRPHADLVTARLKLRDDLPRPRFGGRVAQPGKGRGGVGNRLGGVVAVVVFWSVRHFQRRDELV